jgi:hypothetical protein
MRAFHESLATYLRVFLLPRTTRARRSSLFKRQDQDCYAGKEPLLSQERVTAKHAVLFGVTPQSNQGRASVFNVNGWRLRTSKVNTFEEGRRLTLCLQPTFLPEHLYVPTP